MGIIAIDVRKNVQRNRHESRRRKVCPFQIERQTDSMGYIRLIGFGGDKVAASYNGQITDTARNGDMAERLKRCLPERPAIQ